MSLRASDVEERGGGEEWLNDLRFTIDELIWGNDNRRLYPFVFVVDSWMERIEESVEG